MGAEKENEKGDKRAEVTGGRHSSDYSFSHLTKGTSTEPLVLRELGWEI